MILNFYFYLGLLVQIKVYEHLAEENKYQQKHFGFYFTKQKQKR